MKTFSLILILLVFRHIAPAQNEKLAETAALQCIDEKLKTANSGIDYLLESMTEISEISAKGEIAKLERKSIEIDSILTICGYYKDGDVDMSFIENCMLSSYDPNNKRSDTASCFYKFLKHVNYLKQNPAIFTMLSPILQIEALNLIITPDKKEESFYKVASFLLIQGIMHEISNGNKNSDEALNAKDSNNQQVEVQVVFIAEDNVQIESEMDIDNSSFPCNDEVLTLSEKAPQYPGGEDALKLYLHGHQDNVKGKIYVQFVVNCRGEIINAKVLKGLTPEADKEALKLIANMPIWTPGEQRGRFVNVQVICEVIFD